MGTKRKEMEVAALENGTVIDHIPSDALFKVVSLLELDKISSNITIGNNLTSQKYGKKGIIKIADKFFQEEDINRIALIAPKAILNIIRDYKVIEKIELHIPERVAGIVKCNNPKCITNNEPMRTVFRVLDEEKIQLKCRYCERIIEGHKIELY